jgi:2-polyprenyl-3-methyl-5-hydroxy-6-metoxy-1,4-benzoquinol methylase
MRTARLKKLVFEFIYLTGAARITWHVEEPTPLIDTALRNGWLRPGQRVLEVGCGLGSNGEHLARLGFDVTAVDLSAVAIRKAEQRLRSKGLRAKLYQADFLEGLDEEPFDAVLDRATMHAFAEGPKRDAFARNLAAMVKPGGALLLIELNDKPFRKPPGAPPFVVTGEHLSRLFGGEFDRTEVGEEIIRNAVRGPVPTTQWRLVKRAATPMGGASELRG